MHISVAQAHMVKIFLLKPAAPQGCPCYTWQKDSGRFHENRDLNSQKKKLKIALDYICFILFNIS